MSKRSKTNLALVGIRISETGDRVKKNGNAVTAIDGKNLYSDKIQEADGIADVERFGLTYLESFFEYDKSGALPLDKRPEFERAIQRMENGEVKAIVFPYRDRADRSIATMSEAVRRVDEADGILIAGGSVLTHKDPDSWARSVLESFANEMPSRKAKYNVHKAHKAAIAKGIAPYPPVPGYVKPTGGQFELDPSAAVRETMVEAFEMRDAGKSVNAIRRFITDAGIVSARTGRPYSYAGVESLLRSPTYIGIVKHGGLAYRGEGVPVDSTDIDPVPVHEPLIDPALWHRVQDRKATRGRQPKSARLLARQQVLECKSCGTKMTATNNRGFAFYRCQHNASPDCAARATVSAERVEDMVVAALKSQRQLMKLEGRAAMDVGEQLHAEARAAKARYEAAIDAFGGDDLGAAKRKLAEFRETWQAAEAEAERYDRTDKTRAWLRKLDDWDRLDLDVRQGIIRACVDRVVVAPSPSSGFRQWDPKRVDVQLFEHVSPGLDV